MKKLILLLLTLPLLVGFSQYGSQLKQEGTVLLPADDITEIDVSGVTVTLPTSSETDPVFSAYSSGILTEAEFAPYSTEINGKLDTSTFETYTGAIGAAETDPIFATYSADLFTDTEFAAYTGNVNAATLGGYSSSEFFNRSNHVGFQIASTISDFDATVSSGTLGTAFGNHTGSDPHRGIFATISTTGNAQIGGTLDVNGNATFDNGSTIILGASGFIGIGTGPTIPNFDSGAEALYIKNAGSVSATIDSVGGWAELNFQTGSLYTYIYQDTDGTLIFGNNTAEYLSTDPDGTVNFPVGVGSITGNLTTGAAANSTTGTTTAVNLGGDLSSITGGFGAFNLGGYQNTINANQGGTIGGTDLVATGNRQIVIGGRNSTARGTDYNVLMNSAYTNISSNVRDTFVISEGSVGTPISITKSNAVIVYGIAGQEKEVCLQCANINTFTGVAIGPAVTMENYSGASGTDFLTLDGNGLLAVANPLSGSITTSVSTITTTPVTLDGTAYSYFINAANGARVANLPDCSASNIGLAYKLTAFSAVSSITIGRVDASDNIQFVNADYTGINVTGEGEEYTCQSANNWLRTGSW